MHSRMLYVTTRGGGDSAQALVGIRDMWMKNNRDWVRKQTDDGCFIYDCGPLPAVPA